MAIPTISQPQVASLLDPRPIDSHKGLFGTVSVVGGDSGMVGAALLAGRAALKMGAGSVHVWLLAADAPCVDNVQPELMLHRVEKTLPAAKGILVLGCGMGVSAQAQRLLHDALWSDSPLVLDADALNLIAARLLACHSADIQSDRPAAARRLVERFRCTVVLKGAASLVAGTDGALCENTSGNPGMSAPGMGDVLAGMIAAFIAQGIEASAASTLAVHLHGAAGDTLAARGTELGMTASELTDSARLLLNQWQAK